MIDGATATILSGIGGIVLVEGGAMLFWGGKMSSRVTTLEDQVKPIASLRTDMATLTERMQTLIHLLEPADRARGRRRAAHAESED